MKNQKIFFIIFFLFRAISKWVPGSQINAFLPTFEMVKRKFNVNINIHLTICTSYEHKKKFLYHKDGKHTEGNGNSRKSWKWTEGI